VTKAGVAAMGGIVLEVNVQTQIRTIILSTMVTDAIVNLTSAMNGGTMVPVTAEAYLSPFSKMRNTVTLVRSRPSVTVVVTFVLSLGTSSCIMKIRRIE
jgi:hypothetical protein